MKHAVGQLAILICGAGTAFAALPITFEENRGQTAPQVAFVARTPGYRVFLMRGGAVITLQDGPAVRMRMAGSRDTTPVGNHRLLAKTNYLLGPDSAQWKTGIPNYEGVTYPQVYPGIDLTWHAHGDDIEHDFLLVPGADPRRIRLVLSGAGLRPARVTPEGDLLVASLRFRKPRAYQDGREVECRYVLQGGSVTFALGPYDRARPLTIDPVLSFSTYFGVGTPAATVLDGSGNLNIAGTTASLGFPGTAGTFMPAPAGDSCQEPFSGGGPCSDIFLAKLSGDGQTLRYATYLGGPKDDSATAIAVGPAGNLYIAGVAGTPTAFPKLTALPGQTLGPSFVAELSADGSSLVYATSVPVANGPGVGTAAIAVDSSGSVYLTGGATGGLPTVNAFQAAPADADLFQTVNQGTTWRGIRTDLPPGPFETIAADPSNPQVLYVLSQGTGIYKSTDGGMHWSPIGTGLKGLPSSMALDPHTPQTLYLGMFVGSTITPTVYKSTDGGAKWAGSTYGHGLWCRCRGSGSDKPVGHLRR